jgi:hypothetical protein
VPLTTVHPAALHANTTRRSKCIHNGQCAVPPPQTAATPSHAMACCVCVLHLWPQPHLQHLPEQSLLLIQQHQARPVAVLSAQHQGLLWVVLGGGHVRLPATLQQVTRFVSPRLQWSDHTVQAGAAFSARTDPLSLKTGPATCDEQTHSQHSKPYQYWYPQPQRLPWN